MNVVTELTLDVELTGNYERGMRARQQSDGVWQPCEGPRIEDLRVMLVKGSKRLDITAMLDEDQLRILEESGLELCAFEG